ncbi:hypothetical protein, partial [Klebsiella pneumoniae]|uniref:hypothetical protein n=1 Tax=Klebsiella pneumoniae TaxID=573 RepID=UPI001D182ECC
RELEDKAKLLQTYMTFIVMDNTTGKSENSCKSLIIRREKSLWLMIVIFVFRCHVGFTFM